MSAEWCGGARLCSAKAESVAAATAGRAGWDIANTVGYANALRLVCDTAALRVSGENKQAGCPSSRIGISSDQNSTALHLVKRQTMKINTLLLAVVLMASNLHAQGAFQNLDFEQANIVTIPGTFPIYAVASNAIPGWTAYIGDNPTDVLFYDSLSIGSPNVSIHDSASMPGGSSLQPLQGNYSIGLQEGLSLPAAIGQTGHLPANAKSLIFSASIDFSSRSFSTLQVTFTGNVIPVTQLDSAPGYITLGGDISSYAGQTGELRFSALLPMGGISSHAK